MNHTLKETKLNLGPFNRCIDLVQDMQRVEYPKEFYTDIDRGCWCLFNDDGDIISSKFNKYDNTVECDIIEINYYLEKNRFNNKELLLNYLETKILYLIFELHKKLNRVINFNKIVIPIVDPKIFTEDDKHIYGIIEFGVMVFE